MPTITDNKIKELNEPDLEGPPTQAEVEAAFDGIYLGTRKYDYASFPRPIGRFPAQQNTRRNAVQRTMTRPVSITHFQER